MNIKEFMKCKLENNRFYNVLYPGKMENIDYIGIFFANGFPYIYRNGAIEFIKKLKTIYREGMNFEMIELSIDNENNFAYISEPYDWSKKEITPEIEILINKESTIELCHKNFIGYAVMTIDNLFHLLLTWEQLKNKKASYILLYQDDNNWYDSISFDTEESMNQFIDDHTQSQK